MKRIAQWLLPVIPVLLSVSVPAQTVLLDDFNRPDNTIVGNSWLETETVANTAVNITANQLKLGSTVSGRDFAVQDVSADYNTVLNTNTSILTWAFNIRQSRTDPSGFDNSNYGMAVVIGCSSNDFNTGNGYAVVLGNSGTSDNLRLVRFTNGLDANANMVNVIAPVVDYGNQYLTVKVTYNPVGDLWSLYIGSNLGFFDNPLTASYTQLGATTADGTYTGVDLLFLGPYWNHVTASGESMIVDNFRIPNLCTLSPEPTIQTTNLTVSNIFANSADLSWTNGDGTERIIIAKLNGTVTSVPVDGASYTANSTFGLGTLMAPNEYVVYKGSGSSCTVNGLLPSTSYEFRIFEFEGFGCNINYLQASPAIANATTTACIPDAEPVMPSSAPTVVSSLSSSIQLSWVRGNGDYCLVVGRASSPVSSNPVDGSVYNANNQFGIGSNIGPGEFVVYKGTGTTVTVTGLLSNTTYHFAIFEFNGTGCNTNYLVAPNATVSGITPAVSGYNTYFGNLHAHSDYSDGDLDNVCNGAGSAYCCYNIGNSALNFDFMGIADHNHNEGPVMTPAKYAAGLTEANNYNSTHLDFVALYGMEWGTISTGGHIGVYGIDSLIGWNAGNYDIYCAKGDYNTVFNRVAATPNSFVSLCHPNNTDYGNILGTAYNPVYDNAIISVAVRNGPYNSTSTTYTDAPGGNFVPFFNSMLAKGYHVGPVVDMDNHNSATMGKASQGRTAVLSTALSKSAVIDALLNMRFYATEDYNLNLTYTVNGIYPMGSIVTQTVDPLLDITASDPDGESITTINLWYGIPGSGTAPTILTSVSGSANLNYTHVFATGTYYYYGEIIEADGDISWTSPVWYTKTSNPLPVELLSFTGKHITKGNLLEWATASEINNDFFTIERSIDGINFAELAVVKGMGNTTTTTQYQLLDKNPAPGITYYKLRQTDYDGTCTWSPVIAVEWKQRVTSLQLLPNPNNGTFSILLPDEISDDAFIRIIDATSRTVSETHGLTGQQEIRLDGFAHGLYHVLLFSNETVTALKMIVVK